MLVTQLEKDILAKEIEVAGLKRSLHLQKVRVECETLCWKLELLGMMEADAVTVLAQLHTWHKSCTLLESSVHIVSLFATAIAIA